MKYQSKESLLDDIRSEHDRLCARLAEIPKARWREPGVWGDGWTLLDLVAHLAEWQRMFLRWHEEGLKGVTPQMPAPGYKWSEIPRLNRAIWEKHRSRSHGAVQTDFDSGYGRIVQIAEALSPEQLLESGQFEWTGRNSLATYVGPNTASHYRFALKVIKRWLKSTAEDETAAARPNKRLQPPKARGGAARRRATRPRLRG
ncbi:MAG: ClbS/DfsB family four-helix bundle protein [Chloroflexota bacterium]